MKPETFDEIISSEIEELFYMTYPKLSEQGIVDAITEVKTKMVQSFLTCMNTKTFEEFDHEEPKF